MVASGSVIVDDMTEPRHAEGQTDEDEIRQCGSGDHRLVERWLRWRFLSFCSDRGLYTRNVAVSVTPTTRSASAAAPFPGDWGRRTSPQLLYTGNVSKVSHVATQTRHWRKVPPILRELTGLRITQGALTQDVLRRAEGEVGAEG